MRLLRHVAASTLAAAHVARGLEITINDTSSIDSALSTIAYGMVKYYQGNESGMIPGELGDPYYWWECGAMFNSLINYWYYTGDTTYNAIVKQGMIFQVGPDNDYMVGGVRTLAKCSRLTVVRSAAKSDKSRRKR